MVYSSSVNQLAAYDTDVKHRPLHVAQECLLEFGILNRIDINQRFDTGKIDRWLDHVIRECGNNLRKRLMCDGGNRCQCISGFLLGFLSVRGVSGTAFNAENPVKDKLQIDIRCPAIPLVHSHDQR